MGIQSYLTGPEEFFISRKDMCIIRNKVKNIKFNMLFLFIFASFLDIS